MTALAGDKLNAQRARNALAAEDHLTLGTDCYGRDTSDLTLDSVTKTFSDAVAVQNVSFEAKSGEFISLLGPSGCGKTTTLSMIAGFQDVSSGAISIRGRRVETLPPEKRNTGMVFQDYALFPHMSVAENVSFGLRMRYVPKTEIQERVNKALSRGATTAWAH